jgi:hypothetical protein
MPKEKTKTEAAAGRLISAIQKEWNAELGEPGASLSENVMYSAHDLLQARTSESIRSVLGSNSVTEFLGKTWVTRHPAVLPAIAALEQAIASDQV